MWNFKFNRTKTTEQPAALSIDVVKKYDGSAEPWWAGPNKYTIITFHAC